MREICRNYAECETRAAAATLEKKTEEISNLPARIFGALINHFHPNLDERGVHISQSNQHFCHDNQLCSVCPMRDVSELPIGD